MTRLPPRLAATLLAAPLLASCASNPSQTTRWAGPVTPITQGPTCSATRGLLLRQGDDVSFLPNEGTWILHGPRAPDGTITATQVTIGIDKKPYETNLEARQTPTGIEGTYTTPRCTYRVALTPA